MIWGKPLRTDLLNDFKAAPPPETGWHHTSRWLHERDAFGLALLLDVRPTSLALQAIQLLIMYGADASIQNSYMQTARYLALSDECLKLFDMLEHDGELCRQDLRDRLEDDRAEAAARKEERAAEQERMCAPCDGTHHKFLFVNE